MRGRRAKPLVQELIAELADRMPAGTCLEVRSEGPALAFQQVRDTDTRTAHGFVKRVTDTDDGMSRGLGITFVPGFGPWIPLLPRRLRARLTAQDMVETILTEGFTDALDTTSPRPDFHVQVVAREDQAVISYLPLGAPPQSRVELKPVPLKRFL